MINVALLVFCALAPCQQERQTPPTLSNIEKEIVKAVDKIRPSVVEVKVSRTVVRASQSGGSMSQVVTNEIVVLSGLIIRNDGHIATIEEPLGNNVRSITIVCHDGKEYPAKIVGTDKESGLAVIKAEANLQAVKFAGESDIRSGRWVVAVANSYGLSGSVSMGIVSGLDRTIEINGKSFPGLIQFTAAVSPGDAGGAVSDIDGNAVGVIFSTYSEKKSQEKGSPMGVSGIGFAIPSGVVEFVTESIIKTKSVKRGWIGLGCRNVDKDIAAQLKIAPGKGVVVTSIDKDGPAEKAGLKVNDIILSMGGDEIGDAQKLMRKIVWMGSNAKVKLALLRSGTSMEVEVAVSVR